MPISHDTQASDLGFCEREIGNLALPQQSPRAVLRPIHDW